MLPYKIACMAKDSERKDPAYGFQPKHWIFAKSYGNLLMDFNFTPLPLNEIKG
jgi:hypothetical protein